MSFCSNAIVVSKDFRNKTVFERAELTTGVGRQLVKMFGKPFDLMYYSDVEWNRGRSLVVHAARAESEMIYGAKGVTPVRGKS